MKWARRSRDSCIQEKFAAAIGRPVDGDADACRGVLLQLLDRFVLPLLRRQLPLGVGLGVVGQPLGHLLSDVSLEEKK